MNRQEKENQFSQILEILQNIKNGIVSDCTTELMLTGVMPQAAQQELKALADMTGAVFVGLQSLGIPLEQDAAHDGLVVAHVGGKTFSCAKVNLDFDKIKAPLTASEAYSVTQEPVPAPEAVKEPEPPANMQEPEYDAVEDYDVEEPAVTAGKTPLFDLNEEEFDEVQSNTEVELDPDIEDDLLADGPDDEVETYESDTEDFVEEEPISETVEEDVENDSEIDYDTPVSYEKDHSEIESYEDDEIEDEIEAEETPSAPVFEKPKANVIGGGPVSSPAGFSKNDIFIEEQSKFASEFIYHTSKISVLHPDIGSKPEEMLVMIAPLKIMKYSCPNVPIIVTIFNRGNSVTVSSYDTMDSGKNIVMIDINEYYFLCRGSFDDNGNFKATIATTGPSANQGDRINVLSSKTYGNSQNRETRNGHIKFRYEAESGPGTIEVFPFGRQEEDDFVAIVKNDEFVDYYFISKSLRINSRPIVYTGNGNKQELICQWEGDSLTAELVER